MKLSTLTYKGYTGRVVNVSQSKDITDYVEECYITLPNSSYISSMEAKFTLYEKLIEAGNEVRIEVLDEVENVIYLLHGKATIPKRSKQYTGVEAFEYSIKDSYDKLFDKVVAEDMTFYDLYFCNTGDKGNSLLHKIAISLGFREDQCDFQDAIFPDGKYMRIPFIYLEENTRWVDKLQAFLEATNGILYVQNGMLHFRMRDSNVDMGLRFDRSNLLNHIEESQKELLQNGVKIVYDRYEKLENQVVFNLQKKIITEANTNQDTEVPTMRIGYITSSVSNPVLTKATGYFFTSDDPASKTDITLKEMEHYVIESWSATGAEVRFYNPLPHKLYIDNFEIKGIPLAMYESNEANVMFSNVLEKSQENLMTSTKSSMVQTREQADYLARKTMQKAIVNGKEYSFTTEFLHSIQIGKRYYLTIEDIQEEVEVRSIRISLRPNQFYMDIVADSMTKPLGEVKISNKYSATPNGQYIDLKPLEDKIDSTKSELVEKYDKKLLSLTEKYDEQLVNISDSHKEELSKITEKLGQLTQGIQDSKVKIYTLKPPIDTLTDKNIGDMYISNNSMEILVKEGNKLVWKPMKDEDTKKQLESYMQSTNSKLVTISYQDKAPQKPNVGDIWIDTKNDGIWKRWNGSEWEQVDSIVREALKKANRDIEKIETGISNINNTINTKIMAKAFVQEYEPQSGMKNHDVWYNPKSNTYKVWLNYRWNPASEDDIFPALRHYASLENAKLEMGRKIEKANERAGLFLTNNDEKFGAKNGTLAEVSLDKQGAIRLKNANNLLEWNVKDPWSTTKMKSKFYMGVTDVDKVPDNVYFKIGDETNGFSIELKEGERAKAKLDGKELSQKFGEVNDKVQQSKEELDRNINNLAEANAENKRTLEAKIEQAKEEASRTAQASKEAAQRYADALVEVEQVRADKNATEQARKQAEEKLNLAKNYAEEKAREAKSAAQRYVDTKLQQYASTITKDIQSLQSQVDGAIETWFYDPTPTLQNEPAQNWSSDSDKDKHVGDLYYSKDGKAYRFMKNASQWNTSYEWKLIEDSDVTKALSEAKKAKDTADGKRRVFVLQPKPPYDIGDMWVDNGEVWVCQQEMSSGYFSNHHWRKLKYTDDTKANSVAEQQKSDKKELDRNINNLAQADRENKRDLEEKLNTAKQEINAQLVNADGKLTALQGWYQETVKDITSFKTQTSESINTVQGALQQGNFTVTGNTSFDGAARFVSKGTNEVITIADGAIDFHRDGKRLTRIKNIRHGTISTDSKGKGVVDFEGFQQPMVVIPSIKSLNAGKNMASFFCFAEHIERCKYRFFVGVSNEYWKEVTPVKVIGTEWSSANTVETTLLGIEGFLSNRSWEFPYRKVYEEEAKKWENWSISTYNSYKDYVEQISPPRFVVRAVRYDNTTRVVLFENSYSVPYTVQPSDTTRNKRIEFTSISLQKTMNVLKHYQVRTNMKYVLELQITKANCDVKIFHRLGTRKHNNKESYYEYRNCREANFNGTIFTLTPSSFVGLAITASASTSTLGEVTGEGEVSYIAMEID